MSDDFVYLTAEGLAQMKEELKERKEIRRLEIAERLAAAIKMGDLKENADYHAAKEAQGFNEGRIRELEDAVLRAKVIREDGRVDVVRIGATVTIAEEGYEEEEETYRIVGAREANPGNGFISNESPLGRSLLGARVGQTVTAQTPTGAIKFKVVRIS